MRKILVVTFLVFVGAALAAAAVAQDCRFHNAKLDFRFGTFVENPEPFDFCFEGIKVSGTLNGHYKVCFFEDDLIPSDQIYLLDGYPQIEAEKLYSWIFTDKGDVEFIEWAWYDGDFGLETGFSKVIDGTGDYESAFGTLSWTPRFPNLGPVNRLKGYICTP